MAYPQEIKEYTKTLYLTVGSDGQRKYKSENAILEKISKKFLDLEKIPNQRTLNNWINNKDKTTGKSWKQLWKDGVRYGMQSAAMQRKKEIEGEEEIELEIDSIINLRASNAIMVQEQISKKLEKKEILNLDDIRAWKASELTFNNLNLEITEPHIPLVNFDNNTQNQILEDEESDE